MRWDAASSRVDRVGVGRGRQRLVERGVEDGDVRDVGERLLRGDDPLQVRRVVQRREHRELVDVDLDERRDQRRLEEPGSAVHDAVADGERGVRSSSDGPFSANASSITANPAVWSGIGSSRV